MTLQNQYLRAASHSNGSKFLGINLNGEERVGIGTRMIRSSIPTDVKNSRNDI